MTPEHVRCPPPRRRPLATSRSSTACNVPLHGHDQLLLQVARSGCADAFTALFNHFGPRVEAYLRRLGTPPVQAEDLAQDVMMTVWQRAMQFNDERAPVAAWIFAIARNRLIDVQRRSGREKVVLDQNTLAVATEGEAEEALYLSELERHLRAAIATLPREQNELLRQGYYEDKSQSALADEHHLPLGTIKSRQRLALAKLRRLLSELQ
jgi:RNA polymerase sigma factor (sigma-70 family)